MSAAGSRSGGKRKDETHVTNVKVNVRASSSHRGPVHEDVNHARAWDVASLLIVIRVLNAASMSTFFQPDEFYQGWEPAWALVFGPQSGAWLTWEWSSHLRSSILPAVLAIPLWIVSKLEFILPPTVRTGALLFVPQLVPAGLAAIMEWFTWRAAERIYGRNSNESLAVLLFTVLSPWQWFVSTRTFSNNLETMLTAVGLAYWPWQWMKQRGRKEPLKVPHEMRLSFFTAGLATAVRPTNLLIWLVLSLAILPSLEHHELWTFVREANIYGLSALAFANLLDRMFYGEWVSSTANFIKFNFTQDIAIFYGRNRNDYYLTEGLPLLLTTALPFATAGIIFAFLPSQPVPIQNKQSKPPTVPSPPKPCLRALASAAIAMIAALTLISHKEVRFIYPLLPLLFILAARPYTAWCGNALVPTTTTRRMLLMLALLTNITLAAYVSLIHNRGVMAVLPYLRNEFHLHNPTLVLGTHAPDVPLTPITVGFFMPCHSTPWRSKLVYPDIHAWALTCEPPLDMAPAERAAYLDEADRFYLDPRTWLSQNMQDPAASLVEDASSAAPERREWPQYVAFFEQLEPVIQEALRGTSYSECWRSFNTHWHDDWRRQGDVVVWCVDLGLKTVIESRDLKDAIMDQPLPLF